MLKCLFPGFGLQNDIIPAALYLFTCLIALHYGIAFPVNDACNAALELKIGPLDTSNDIQLYSETINKAVTFFAYIL